ncbi:adenosylcobinamide amidohydrolase [Priestia flexa]|uniref:adenosylcobinamide amidohydrolase n=1 Tax=Priestia flexa TaxID=86664 RepID=UPI001CD63F6B|nr:adenosylcobinamide amidohydrolase [Priestia flexa]MCA1201329.1 adenosylcobinamide amidohydrolase [Priestia flexa]MCG7312340.1 adenosylcobinamide amidohydrolase [Priestia flexa]WHX80501.1 adenosylcobinamide amidohydrolase [Priestia flexa]
MKTSIPFKAYSSGVLGDGMLETTVFYNRFVHKYYRADSPAEEYRAFLKEKGFVYDKVVGLMTAVYLRNKSVYTYCKDGLTVSSIITAGVGNAVDLTSDDITPFSSGPGTINMFIFIDGKLTDAAFLQLFIAATEVKTRMLYELGVQDSNTETLATGTSTDSICIAASQTGSMYEYGGSMTALGQAVGKLVKLSLLETIQKR